MTILSYLAAQGIVLFARLITAVRAIWQGTAPEDRQRIYFANHVSNGDFVLLWAALPAPMRRRTRPVAAADYWLTTPLRRFIGEHVFKAVLIDRNPDTRTRDPVDQMAEALEAGASLILFPEGKRNMTEERLLPLKTGLYHLAGAKPDVDLVPAWIDNLNRVMPKGEVVPIPIICTVTFGAPLRLGEGEDKAAFLARAQAALLSLAPRTERTLP